ncbi:MAG: hypothetical protein RSB91_09145 [Clostridia bacterium]
MQSTMVRHNPFTFYLRVLLYMFLALLLRVITFAPLLCLALPAGSPLRWGALLCPVLVVFLLLPLRLSFAEALVQRGEKRFFSFDTALSSSSYGEKLTEGLLHAVNVLKWGVPFLLMLGYCYYCYKAVDMFTLLAALGNIGKSLTDVWCAVSNFFITLFGSIQTLTSKGGLMEGLFVVSGVLGIGMLIWIYGAVRNSATRYIWVLASRAEHAPRTEVRRRLRGRRWRQLLVGMVNLLLWIPFVVVICMQFKGVVSDLSGQLMMMIAQQQVPSMDLAGVAMPMVAAFLCLYMPLLPIRRCITATFATRPPRPVTPKNEPVVSAVEQQAQPDTNAAAQPASEQEPVFHAEVSEPVYAQEFQDLTASQAVTGPFAQADQPVTFEDDAPVKEASDPSAFTLGQ